MIVVCSDKASVQAAGDPERGVVAGHVESARLQAISPLSSQPHILTSNLTYHVMSTIVVLLSGRGVNEMSGKFSQHSERVPIPNLSYWPSSVTLCRMGGQVSQFHVCLPCLKVHLA